MVSVPADVFTTGIRLFWEVREGQWFGQEARGARDIGQRGAVTGGRHFDGMLMTIESLVAAAGVPAEWVHRRRPTLPCYYRPTKQWDLVVVDGERLLAAIEIKSQVGPSFGNNANNRVEEALGSAVDLWTAFREGRFGTTRPWLGYLFVLEDCARVHGPTRIDEPHFPVEPAFAAASYAQRYELLCRRLVLERQYDGACLLLTDRDHAQAQPNYREPAADLGAEPFLRGLLGHLMAQI